MHHHQKSEHNCPFSLCSNGLICRHQGSTKSLPSNANAPDYTDHHKLCTILTPQRHNLTGMLLWCSLCEDDETVHRWAGEQPALIHLGYDAEDPLALPWRSEEDLIIGCYLCVTATRRERRQQRECLYTVISPPPHGSGFMSCSLLNPKHHIMSCAAMGSAL